MQTIFIIGTNCPACKTLVERRIAAINGVTEVNVDFKTGKTDIGANRQLTEDEINKSLEGTHYEWKS